MITIKVVHKAKNLQETEEFFKSLFYSYTEKYPVELILDTFYPKFIKNIRSVSEPSEGSVLCITLPDDVLVLGNAWEAYLKLAIEDGLPQHGQGKNFIPTWEGYVQRRMALQSRRPPEGFFPDLKVEILASPTTDSVKTVAAP